MTRDAARVYFDLNALRRVENCRKDLPGKVFRGVRDMSPECRLGCTLNRGNVTVRTLHLDRTILHVPSPLPKVTGELEISAGSWSNN